MSEKRSGTVWPLLLIFVGVIATFAAAMLVVFREFAIQRTGNLGDASSLIGALFSALAFGGVIVAILLQRQELRLQRDELSMTRAELEGQKAQLAAQNRTMSRDVFESCFFQLLRLNRECVETMSAMFAGSNNLMTGPHSFRQAAAHLMETAHFEFDPQPTVAQVANLIATDFMRYCLAPTSDFGHYFRNLYHVFAFIERSDLSPDDKVQYAKIVRAQLSTAELVLLFANGQTERGKAFTKFITKYALFERAGWPQTWWRYRRLFPESAYGEASQGSA
jgi:hypothetical protein